MNLNYSAWKNKVIEIEFSQRFLFVYLFLFYHHKANSCIHSDGRK